VVVGAGSFGTAVAVLLARGGFRTTLQTRTAEQCARLEADRENRVYLPGLSCRASCASNRPGRGSAASTTSSWASRRAPSAT
jgi:glycerol-3-phosphate dehydrogenase (NAD(P)+)